MLARGGASLDVVHPDVAIIIHGDDEMVLLPGFSAKPRNRIL